MNGSSPASPVGGHASPASPKGANGTPPARTPLASLLEVRPVVFTILAGEALALILALSPALTVDRWIYFGLSSLMIQWISLLTMGLLFLTRNLLAGLTPIQTGWSMVVALLASTWVVSALVLAVFDEAWPLPRSSPTSFYLQVSAIALIVALFGLIAFQNHWRTTQLAIRAKQAELESLQARTHPHFLFNTLNTGAALIRAKPDAAESLLLDLADLFRAALTGPRYIPLEDELDLARRYLAIEQLRLGSRLEVHWETPPSIPDVMVPSLSVQPLIENAIRHGVERLVSGGRVDILVVATPPFLSITVRNDTPPSSQQAESPGHRIGLASVRQRVVEMTGGAGDLIIINQPQKFVVTLSIPL